MIESILSIAKIILVFFKNLQFVRIRDNKTVKNITKRRKLIFIIDVLTFK